MFNKSAGNNFSMLLTKYNVGVVTAICVCGKLHQFFLENYFSQLLSGTLFQMSLQIYQYQKNVIYVVA